MSSDRDKPVPSGGGGTAGLLIFGGIGVVLVTLCCCVPGGVGGLVYWTSVKTAEDRQARIEKEAEEQRARIEKEVEERQARIEKEEGIAITAEDMGRQHAENGPAAEAKFKDKIITVTGRIIYIERDSVRLQPGVPPGQIVIGGVYCTFGDKYKGQIANLKNGDRVTIRGYYTGQGFAETGKLIYCKKIE
jgi:hypothetical protein